MNLARRRTLSLLLLLVVSLGATSSARYGSRVLRVCSDPNNLPFSNQKQQGFENRIADLLAKRLDARLEYTWWAQRRGFVRNTLRAQQCDLVVGVPVSFELTLPTRPYYRSSYVFVTRRDSGLNITSFDDPQLRELIIGVQLVGDDYANTPPAHALEKRGIVQNLRGYTVYGDYAQPNPPARILDAVTAKEVDVAVVWGPLAGWYARNSAVPLQLTPVQPQIDLPYLPMIFDVSMGVRRTDIALRDEIDAIIASEQRSIERILDSYGVVKVDP